MSHYTIDELTAHHAARLRVEEVEALALVCDVGLIQVVAAHLVLVLQEQFAVGDGGVVPAQQDTTKLRLKAALSRCR